MSYRDVVKVRAVALMVTAAWLWSAARYLGGADLGALALWSAVMGYVLGIVADEPEAG